MRLSRYWQPFEHQHRLKAFVSAGFVNDCLVPAWVILAIVRSWVNERQIPGARLAKLKG